MSKWNILVVDDDPLNREIIADYLEDGPYSIRAAGNGLVAWQLLENPDSAFDLVILDRMMPVMDGMELLAHMKSEPRHANIPVIMQTAATSVEQVREGLNAGCYFYLTKPYKQAELLCSVHAALEQLRQDRLLLDELAEHPPIPASENAEYSFATLEEAQRLAAMFAAQCPEPGPAAMGLTELMINAVEHGNLGITYAEKSQLKRDDTWQDEVARRVALPENIRKKARAHFKRGKHEIVFTISDQGQGFDWAKYLDFDPARAFDPNGRGIAMAGKLVFTKLDYQGNGNKVVATIKLNSENT